MPRRPLHLRLREKILNDLVRADLAPGQRYSTEGELAHRFSVSRNTLRKAMAGLEQDGYLSRRRRIGAIAGRRPLSGKTRAGEVPISRRAAGRRRATVILPIWDDSVEGRYAGQLLRALASPELATPLSVEIRHPSDPVSLAETADTVVVAIDPRGRAVRELQQLAERGARIIVFGPEAAWPEFILVGGDRYRDAYDAVRKLYELGHRAVGLINQDLSHIGFSHTLMGYLDAHRDLGRSIPPGALIQQEHASVGDDKPDVRAISGWICSFIAAVRMVASRCAEEGLSIPENVSVITLDDPGDIIIPEVGKPVSAYRTHFIEAAQRIGELIHDWPEACPKGIIPISSRWVDRRTVAAPR